METGITVTPQKLRDVSTHLEAGASDIDKLLSGVAEKIAPVRSEWRGAAKEQFETLLEQLQRQAKAVHGTLTGLAKLTHSAAASYEAAEQAIAKSFSDFRLEIDRLSEELTQVNDRIKAGVPPKTGGSQVTEVEDLELDPPSAVSGNPNALNRRLG